MPAISSHHICLELVVVLSLQLLIDNVFRVNVFVDVFGKCCMPHVPLAPASSSDVM